MDTLFYKLQASGNDFILIDRRRKNSYRCTFKNYRKIASWLCTRRTAIGGDGLLVIENSKVADFKMRIFNADGSEAEMCGNGARCVALWARLRFPKKKEFSLETKAGIIHTTVSYYKKFSLNNARAKVRIGLTPPYDLKEDLSLEIGERKIRVSYINTGVPHTVIFVEKVDIIDVERLGKYIRSHKMFLPAGTNVDFLEVVGRRKIRIRTYERGVERETLACGTGAVASAIIYALKYEKEREKLTPITVYLQGGDTLKVSFKLKEKNIVEEVDMEGEAYLVYRGYSKMVKG